MFHPTRSSRRRQNFTRTGSVWTQQAYIKASNAGAGDWFGFNAALASDGNTLAVGATLEASNATGIGGSQADNSAAGAGAAYVFTRAGSVWTQQAYVKASNTDAGDAFGWTVALSSDGSALTVGAYLEASNAVGAGGDQANNSAAGAGAVYVFGRSGTAWTQRGYVKASNTATNDNFGFRTALSSDGHTIAVGGIGEASNATGIGGDQTNNAAAQAGAVYVILAM